MTTKSTEYLLYKKVVILPCTCDSTLQDAVLGDRLRVHIGRETAWCCTQCPSVRKLPYNSTPTLYEVWNHGRKTTSEEA